MSIAAAADKCNPDAGSSKANENRLTSILKQLPAGELRTFWSSLVPPPMALITSCHQLALASWMSDNGLIFTLWRRKSWTEEINILSAVSIFDGVSVFCPSKGHVWLEFCKVMGRIKSCRAETQASGSLALLKGGKKDVKIHRIGKEINSGIYYTASTVPRTEKVRLLFWHAVQQAMTLVGAQHRRKIRDYYCRVTRSKSRQHICDGFSGSPTTYVSLDIMCGLRFETQRARLPQLLTRFLCQMYQLPSALMLVHTRTLRPSIEGT